MTTSPKPRKCMYCRENQVVPTVLPSHVEEMEHDGRKYSVSVVNSPTFSNAKTAAS